MSVDQRPVDLPISLRPDRAHTVGNARTVNTLICVGVNTRIGAVVLRADPAVVGRLTDQVRADAASVSARVARFGCVGQAQPVAYPLPGLLPVPQAVHVRWPPH